jgi:signal transduction histidine kinase
VRPARWAQQRLVHTVVTLKLARRALERDRRDPTALINEAQEQAQTPTDELRELAHGILPSVVTHGRPVGAGVKALAFPDINPARDRHSGGPAP